MLTRVKTAVAKRQLHLGRIKTAIRDGDAFVTMEDGLEIFYLLLPVGGASIAMRVRWFIATTAMEPRRDSA